jgi:hypothetical protein
VGDPKTGIELIANERARQVQAEGYDAAVAIARECPGNNVIEIRELGGYA